MKILILGSKGQLGQCLIDQLIRTNYDVVYTSRDQIDIADFSRTKRLLLELSPDLVINAAAYTAVDKAEEDDLQANLINNLAVANIAKICWKLDCWLFHVSTDFIFDGDSSLPYKESDQANPLGVYGQSKLMGEESIQASSCKYLIFRTAWVFSQYGNNFLKTMLRLGETHEVVRVVDDQIGCPTAAHDIARVMISIIPYLESKESSSGIYNICSDNPCSWYDFARKIFKVAEAAGFPTPKNVYPISSSEYPYKTPRPSYSVLNCSKIHKKFNVEPLSLEESILKVISKL
jgi:dTDP-4-dehydrorhamnose reductase